jgi:hypothetical protein
MHWRMVTYWEAGPEHLSPRTAAIFEAWGAVQTAPFRTEDEQLPALSSLDS